MEESPKCYECELKLQGRPMKEIGGVGKQVQYSDMEGKNFGVREVKLYQCEVCRLIRLS